MVEIEEQLKISQEEYRSVPIPILENSTKKMAQYEIIYCAILGVMGGIISSLIPFGLLIKIWYPLYGGQQLTSGHHLIWASIVYGLTKKKRSIMTTMLFKGLLEFMLGDLWSVIIIFANLLEGFCLVVGFKLMELFKENETKLGWGLAGGFGNFFQAPFFWTLNQRWHFHFSISLLTFLFAFISGVLITGVLGRAIKNHLIQAGVPTML
ncbi:MAG: membrane protein of unknown function [Promethearchaeota archaeon]|jgi:ABC-type thiamin/hydroxymethylpyrimidine transport system permease subunit|nr:MAG: membrane protein of unknown function [Candidatus Lokiarchaeota archaeon]